MTKTSELLIQLRKNKNLTQNDLAQQLGVTSQAVSKWERGENLPDSMILLKLSEMYNITIEEILSGELKPTPPKKVKNENFTIFVAAFIFMLSALPMVLFYNINRPVSILSTVVLASIGALILLYVALKEEEN